MAMSDEEYDNLTQDDWDNILSEVEFVENEQKRIERILQIQHNNEGYLYQQMIRRMYAPPPMIMFKPEELLLLYHSLRFPDCL